MDLEQKAIERIKMASEMSLQHYGLPLIITTSGGKDSDVCLELAKRSGVPYEVQHSLTTADAPQTIYHIRQQFRELELQGIKCTINLPIYRGQRTSMWKLIPAKQMPPTRLMRYCCEVLKERAASNRLITTGVRWDESNARRNRGVLESIGRKKENKIVLMNDNDEKRQLMERCQLKAKIVCNPIIDWKTSDVWNYIKAEHFCINPLYYCGFDRVGCIGCPMVDKKRYFEFRIFPQYEQNYIRAFDRMLLERERVGKTSDWKTGEDVFRWWMEEDPNQIRFEDVMEG